MPSEHVQLVSPPPPPQTLQSAQVKACADCQRPLTPPEDDIAALLLLSNPLGHEALTLCPCCRQGPSRQPQSAPFCPQRSQPSDGLTNSASLHGPASNSAALRPPVYSPSQQRPLVSDDPMFSPDSFPSLLPASRPDFFLPPSSSRPLPIPQPRSSALFVDTSSFSSLDSSLPSSSLSSISSVAFDHKPWSPDTLSPTRHAPPTPNPLVDITHIRLRPQPHRCLYPGSTFEGTQKSGRNSYDVTVTIIDVDFMCSRLCGYLCIRGLTEDWPELTTYFDAELIGSRYGFLTRKWGATEEDDMVHWGRFPAFRHIKNKLKTPNLTTDADTGAVFMRWKERFLVPDHRVQDINGASFAGFYYVCVDFNACGSTATQQQSQQQQYQPGLSPPSSPSRTRNDATPKPERRARSGVPRADTTARTSTRSPSAGARGGPVVATMSGFYFHQHSEPYQQLSLNHVPDRMSTGFELR